MKTLLQAGWVAPITAPLLRDAAVVFDAGRIIAVGDSRQMKREHPDAQVIARDDAIVLPGLVNPHTHLELSECTCGPSHAGKFADWILSLPARLRRDNRSDEEIFQAATLEGIAQCIRFGVTCVGDISQQHRFTRPVLAASPIRAVSYGEAIGLGKRRPLFDDRLARAIDAASTSKMRIGLTPHAPYTVDLDGYIQCLKTAQERAMPLATHLAENPDEREFLENRTGQFRELWQTLDSWTDSVQTFPGSPIQMASAIGLLDYPTLLAHVNYCADNELGMLAAGKSSVVYCPRTHAYFGHPPHRWREMLNRGINVAIATDSCASSPDLNLLDDLRLAHKIAPEFPIEQLWEMVTIRAARAIQMEDESGSISIGKAADLAVFSVTSKEPLRGIIESTKIPDEVYVDGSLVAPASRP